MRLFPIPIKTVNIVLLETLLSMVSLIPPKINKGNALPRSLLEIKNSVKGKDSTELQSGSKLHGMPKFNELLSNLALL